MAFLREKVEPLAATMEGGGTIDVAVFCHNVVLQGTLWEVIGSCAHGLAFDNSSVTTIQYAIEPGEAVGAWSVAKVNSTAHLWKPEYYSSHAAYSRAGHASKGAA